MYNKLIRGIVYDNVDVRDEKSKLFDKMYSRISDSNEIESVVKYFHNDLGIDEHAAMQYFTTADDIAILTGYDFESDFNNNLIIPKIALSENLVKELESVDIGKNLLNDYINDFADRIIGENNNSDLNENNSIGTIIKIPKDSELGNIISEMLKVS